MSNEKWLVSKSILEAAADTIRSKLSVSSSFAPKDFASKIREIPSDDYLVKSCIDGTLTDFIDSSGLITAIPTWAFASKPNINILSFPACSTVGSYAFYSCEAKQVYLDNCTYLSNYAFSQCKSLQTINISKVKVVPDAAFYNCFKLNSVSLTSCTEIKSSAFYSCIQLQSVTLGPECTTIGSNAFYFCYSLNSINLETCINIMPNAFGYCSSLVSVSLPNLFGDLNCFNNCQNLESIYLGSDNLVFKCTGLASCKISSIDLPNCNYIAGFSNCSLLATGSFPAAVLISSNAFRSCPEITEAFIPACYTMGAYAFANCTKLSKVTMLNTLSSWHYWNTGMANTAFSSTPITDSTYLGYYGSIYVPSNLLSSYQALWGDRVTIIDSSYDSNFVYGGEFYSKTISSIPEAKLTAEMILNHAFNRCGNISEVSFPNCSFIGEYAFYSCSNLIAANFPAVKNVLNSAFVGCNNLASINLPNCLYLSQYVFGNCSKLANISLQNCTYIGPSAFIGCSLLQEASFSQCRYIGTSAFMNTGVSSIFLPKISSIYAGTFTNTKIRQLTDVELPICTWVGSSAFKSCSQLTKVALANCSIIGASAFENCQNLSVVKLINCWSFGIDAFRSCYRLITLDLTEVSLVPSMLAGTFGSTPIDGYSAYTSSTPHIYVPASLYNSFITNIYWSSFSDKIVSVS